ncbi:TPM domain-containing protein [Epilithonimonas sp.]|uniref:TPM domain-containing protein n=1 Tax=Epilithonimonas sp. TaxID=2894511 RepID=UPI00289D6456|nr:TPM domain-containing protein [Epilithonimonas sp.]
MMNQFLTDTEMASLVEAIKIAEDHSSGEIRVHIDSTAEDDFAKKAFAIFRSLEMHQTKERNGVLFYVNFVQHYLTIIGDEGIHKKVKQQFWDTLHDEITSQFARENYCEGLKEAILKTGLELKKYFPVDGENINELSNDISFS